MNGSVLQADLEKRRLVFDPRTKLLMLVTMSTLVLGGLLRDRWSFLFPCFCAVPLLLLLSQGRFRTAIIYVVLYSAAYGLYAASGPYLTGFWHFLVLGTCGILTKFMPSIMLAAYVVSSTTVSEFTAAMQRLHLSEKLIIPLSVMFRFFPTVADEFSSINAAMKMRGIALGGSHLSKILEYRLIPLMSCSVKIGEELSAAALTRGLGGTVRRTNVCKIGFHVQDVLMILLCGVPLALGVLDGCKLW